MVLALDYMQRTDTGEEALREKARQYVAQGYQRLLGFEVLGSGGFDWWGKPPANLFLTAYAMLEFSAINRVHPVSPALLDRIATWLHDHQHSDGSWAPHEERKAWSTDMAKGRSFNLTAYTCWALARAGHPSAAGIAWLRDHMDEAEDAYSLALAALAFHTSDARSDGRSTVDRLVASKTQDQDGPSWDTAQPTGIGARGTSARIEATALAILALAHDDRHPLLMDAAVERLVKWRSEDGTFGATQSTILALEALLAAEGTGRPGPSTVSVVDGSGGTVATCEVDPASTEPLRVPLPHATDVSFQMAGEGKVRATLSRTGYRSWAEPLPAGGRVALAVRWPEEVAVGRLTYAEVRIENPSDAPASVVTAEIGIPPGCEIDPTKVDGECERAELGERRLVLYLRDLGPGESKVFRVPFTPRYELDVVTAPSKAYEYYTPEEAAYAPPSPLRAR